ncbi:hypothetical protein AGMMS49990_10360 [Endomicrobiia bacterium]|nr:hypothetical protein AGMMS49990_10360 [Endomicrobiia bacterium]
MKDLTRRQKETRSINKNNNEIPQEGKSKMENIFTIVLKKLLGAEMKKGSL